MKEEVKAIITVVLIVIAKVGLSWATTCILIKLISMCFGFAFSWKFATGIWLILFILKSVFKVSVE
jgi:hypothetical protein